MCWGDTLQTNTKNVALFQMFVSLFALFIITFLFGACLIHGLDTTEIGHIGISVLVIVGGILIVALALAIVLYNGALKESLIHCKIWFFFNGIHFGLLITSCLLTFRIQMSTGEFGVMFCALFIISVNGYFLGIVGSYIRELTALKTLRKQMLADLG